MKEQYMKALSGLKPIMIIMMLALLPIGVSANEELKTNANIVGHVTDKVSGEPMAHVAVQVEGTMMVSVTNAEGYYHLEDLPLGKQTIEARTTGYRAAKQTIKVEKNAKLTIDFVLERDEISLDEVVVSSNRSVSLRRNAPTLVNVIDTRTFNITNSMCLAQGLNFQPGVRTEDNCANCGFSQVRINGLDGHYSQILIDSRPVFSALQGVYGLEQIPANMIERVEVVRGGGSALYGSSAIGGTINIITKEPLSNYAELAHTFTAYQGGKTFDNNTTVNTSIVSNNNKAGFSVYGQSHNRGGYDRDQDGFTDLPKLINKTIGMGAFLRLNNYSKLKLQYHALNEYRRGGNNLHLPVHESNIAEKLDHNINGGSLSYDLFTPNGLNHFTAYTSFQTVSRDSYYGGTGDGSEESKAEALKAYSKTHDTNVMGGMQFVHNFGHLLFMPAHFTLGAEYTYDALKDHALGYDVITRQTVRTGSLFLQNEWKDEHWGILLGGRFDKHNLINHLIFSPRANLRFNVTDNVHLRLTYAGGFRAPQTFDEDLHTSMAGGERIKTYLAKGLKEERSNSLSFSADMYYNFGSVQTNFLVEAFYTHLNNVFAQRVLKERDENGIRILERFNANQATVWGMNAEGKAVFSKWFSLQSGLTVQRSEYKDAVEWDEDAPAEKKFLRTPNVYGYFTMQSSPAKRLSIALSGNYNGRMLVGHAAGSGVEKPVAVHTPSFFTLSLKASYDFDIYKQVKAQLNAGIQNIGNVYQRDLDKGWNRDASYIYGPSLPRCFYVGLKLMY
ncbi:TonB-dependent receptor [Prevotella falsenii]|uniref:TonB-dependent receptor n=1 Tax=Prevotella falsenii TaxID=515414 RepID=UPI0004681FBE|nr:TonB-dependent receptor [Prevotella falsenii]